MENKHQLIYIIPNCITHMQYYKVHQDILHLIV